MNYELIIKSNSYYDSVTLMSLTKKALNIEGIENVLIAMGTVMNKNLASKMIENKEVFEKITENDLFILIVIKNESLKEDIINNIENLFNQKDKDNKEIEYTDISQVVKEHEDVNLAIISIPGEYAFREAMKALKNNLHVMLFSDNMSIDEEIKLKEYAISKNLLLMGPDCGTSVINNIGLCFSNKIKKGNIGIVGASGTGIQEAIVQLSKKGLGISQAIGTGGRDLKKEVGGLMMLSGLEALNNDPQTEIIVLISKPPAKEVEKKIFEKLKTINKKKIIYFIDGEKIKNNSENMIFVNSLLEIAEVCSSIKLNKKITEDQIKYIENYKSYIKNKNIIGLYCGGTLCAESLALLREYVNNLRSNVAKKDSELLLDLENFDGNVLIDLGDDHFTKGKAHPMIDPSIRLIEIEKAVNKNNTGIIILDFEIGYGANENPVEETYNLIKKLQNKLKQENKKILFITYLCGTEEDYQGYEKNKKLLEEISLTVNSNEEISNIIKYILK